jgi:hypothetical protein
VENKKRAPYGEFSSQTKKAIDRPINVGSSLKKKIHNTSHRKSS